MTPEDIQRMFGHLLPGSVTVVQMRRRSWRERLFSLPWRPMVATEQATTDNPLGNVLLPPEVEQFLAQQREQRPAAPRSRRAEVFVAPCAHCAIMGAIEMWVREHGQHLPPLILRHQIQSGLMRVLDDLEARRAGVTAMEH